MKIQHLEKTVWRETLAYYSAWNDAELHEQIAQADTKPPAQKWHEFLALMEFGLMIKPQPSFHEHQQKIDMLNRYYQQLQQFEERRKGHGK